MINRFQRIQREFGTLLFLRIASLPFGLIGMTLVGYFAFSSILAGMITLVGLILGFLLRSQIADNVDHYSRVIPIGLFIFGAVGFLGDRFGVENNIKLAIITVTTVIIFNLHFWSLSDEAVVNVTHSNQEQITH
jgi:hypothetical protein